MRESINFDKTAYLTELKLLNSVNDDLLGCQDFNFGVVTREGCGHKHPNICYLPAGRSV